MDISNHTLKGAVMVETIGEFLDQEAAVEILCVIGADGARFQELVEGIDASHTTISKRLGEGASELNIFEEEPIRGERGTAHKWTLTAFGGRLLAECRYRALTARHEILRQARSVFETEAEQFRKWVKENEEKIKDEPVIVTERGPKGTVRFPGGRRPERYQDDTDDDS